MGAWIETHINGTKVPHACVAPYVGAWIETMKECRRAAELKSHLTWVRGLKLRYRNALAFPQVSHLTWVRGLKHQPTFAAPH